MHIDGTRIIEECNEHSEIPINITSIIIDNKDELPQIAIPLLDDLQHLLSGNNNVFNITINVSTIDSSKTCGNNKKSTKTDEIRIDEETKVEVKNKTQTAQNNVSVAEQRRRAREWAEKEFGKKKSPKPIIEISVEEQRRRAREWAEKEFRK